MLDLVVGQPLDDALVVLERACSHAGQAYRLGLSIAVERAMGVKTPRAAQLGRAFFAELEMAQSALWALAEIARALNLHALRTRGLGQRERIYQRMGEVTGERVFWSIARPGGVREGIQLTEAREILDWLPQIIESWHEVTAPKGALRRAAERIDAQQAKRAPSPSSLSGPAGSGGESEPAPTGGAEVASISREDARRASPYGGYRYMTLDWSSLDDGQGAATDVASLALRLVTHLKLSYDIMRVCTELLGDAKLTQARVPMGAGQGSVTVQTAHGPARLDVTLASDQTIAQLRLTTACAATMAEVPGWLVERKLAHVPAILAGLDLCPSCADL